MKVGTKLWLRKTFFINDKPGLCFGPGPTGQLLEVANSRATLLLMCTFFSARFQRSLRKAFIQITFEQKNLLQFIHLLTTQQLQSFHYVEWLKHFKSYEQFVKKKFTRTVAYHSNKPYIWEDRPSTIIEGSVIVLEVWNRVWKKLKKVKLRFGGEKWEKSLPKNYWVSGLPSGSLNPRKSFSS